MDRITVLASAILLVGTRLSGGPVGMPPEQQLAPKTLKERASYVLGHHYGVRLYKRGIREVDLKWFEAGMSRGIVTKPPLVGARDFGKVLGEYEAEQTKGRADARRKLGEVNEKEGEAFLAKNAKKPGVTVTTSGLQYEVLREGKGETPTDGHRVKVQYEGRRLDGSVFDSSYVRKKPVAFPLKRLIPGWIEGLKLMKVGAKHRLFLPSKLAYGPRGKGGRIGPNATLIFDLELLGVEKMKRRSLRDHHGSPHRGKTKGK